MRTKTPFRYAKKSAFTKWTHEATTTTVGWAGGSTQYTSNDITIVPSTSDPTTTYQGPRKAKNFTISLTCNDLAEANSAVAIGYVLVYVPYTRSPSTPDWNGPVALYEPSNEMISCGLLNTENSPIRIKSSMSRILNSGDSIHLILTNLASIASGSGLQLHGLVEFSITQ